MNPKLKARIRAGCEAVLPRENGGILLGIKITLAVETAWDLLEFPNTDPPLEAEIRTAASLVAGMIEAVRGNDDEAAKVRLRIVS